MMYHHNPSFLVTMFSQLSEINVDLSAPKNGFTMDKWRENFRNITIYIYYYYLQQHPQYQVH